MYNVLYSQNTTWNFQQTIKLGPESGIDVINSTKSYFGGPILFWIARDGNT